MCSALLPRPYDETIQKKIQFLKLMIENLIAQFLTGLGLMKWSLKLNGVGIASKKFWTWGILIYKAFDKT